MQGTLTPEVIAELKRPCKCPRGPVGWQAPYESLERRCQRCKTLNDHLPALIEAAEENERLKMEVADLADNRRLFVPRRITELEKENERLKVELNEFRRNVIIECGEDTAGDRVVKALAAAEQENAALREQVAQLETERCNHGDK
jgi:hypothetical protein